MKEAKRGNSASATQIMRLMMIKFFVTGGSEARKLLNLFPDIVMFICKYVANLTKLFDYSGMIRVIYW